MNQALHEMIGPCPDTAGDGGGGEGRDLELIEKGGREIGRALSDRFEAMREALDGLDTVLHRSHQLSGVARRKIDLTSRLANR